MSLDRGPADARNAGALVSGARGAAGRSLANSMGRHAEPAAALMKALSHPGRLMILCHLADGEKAVQELEVLTGQRQAAVSQQLARLRMEGMVTARRSGKAIIYALRDAEVMRLLSCLSLLFDRPD